MNGAQLVEIEDLDVHLRVHLTVTAVVVAGMLGLDFVVHRLLKGGVVTYLDYALLTITTNANS